MLVRVEDIAIAVRPVPPGVTLAAAHDTFLLDPSLFAIPLVSGGAALGMVTRSAVNELMSQPDARQRLGARQVSEFMSRPVMAEAKTAVALVAKLAAEGKTAALTDGVIALSDGQYLGLISPSALLTAVAQENAARARVMQNAQKRLAEAKVKMDELVREKSRFLTFVGHEIRTPLTGILGVADLLQDSISASEPKRLARTISESGTHLDRLLTDLLDLSRLEAGKLPVASGPFDLREFANEARDLWQSRMAGKRLDLRIRVDSDAVQRLESDAMRIRQILFNLMSNALKFTERGYIGVTLSTHEAAGNLKLRMTVEDTGCGITDDDKARLFEAFEQAKASTATTHGGSGLGLSIAKGIAKRLGGDITLADNPEGGSIFTVTVPVLRAGPRLAATATPVRPRTRTFELGRILLAEDHAVSALVMTRALSAAGWQVETVQNGADALDRIRETAFQAILTDIHMPGINGEELLKAVRGADGPNRHIPVIAVTADVSPERRLSCQQLGFSTLIEKPIRPRVLVATLADVLIAGDVEEAEALKLA